MSIHSVDLAFWGDVVIKAGALTVALYGLYRVWVRPVVRWFQHQGEMNAQVAQVVADELPKMTRAIEHVSNIQNDHDEALRDLRGRVQRLEGASDEQPEIPLTPGEIARVAERLRRGSHIPGPEEHA